ncbi:hypothetical protein PR048_003819 [Dryococelus australis]|uniref:Uncharacterized protein n=1 Tax=Dryococelus australis TaxID=614101 RepID=A0ABQ9IP74_9NEOP|nr:hypothetical protein PR048_003819 [Dryococelus australis]
MEQRRNARAGKQRDDPEKTHRPAAPSEKKIPGTTTPTRQPRRDGILMSGVCALLQLAYCLTWKALTGESSIFTGGMAWSISYDLPNETISQHSGPILPVPEMLRRHRRDLYRKIEVAMESSFGEKSINPRLRQEFALTARSREPMRVIEVNSVGLRGEGETGYPRESPPPSGIVRHDSHMQKSGSGPSDEPTLEDSTFNFDEVPMTTFRIHHQALLTTYLQRSHQKQSNDPKLESILLIVEEFSREEMILAAAPGRCHHIIALSSGFYIRCCVRRAGLDGRSCVLRAICETAQQLKPRSSLFLEIFRILFTCTLCMFLRAEPPLSGLYFPRLPLERVAPHEPSEHWQYDSAHRRGLANHDCQDLYPSCSVSLLDTLLQGPRPDYD